MNSTELIKRIKRIEIKSRGLSNEIFSGQYHSAFKGQGMAFSEVREYQHGDEIRTIDWNVTARFGEPYVKVFEEERELTVILLIDLSKSESFGSKQDFKKDIITEIAATLAFSAIQNNDKIGVVFFTDKVEKFIPPKKGKKHVMRIISDLINFEPTSSGTNIESALQFLNSAVKRKSTVFLMSDFIDEGYETSLSISNKKHDLIALRIFDLNEIKIPKIGITKLIDQETNQEIWVNTSSKKFQKKQHDWWKNFESKFDYSTKRAGVDVANIDINQPYSKALSNLFKKREHKR